MKTQMIDLQMFAVVEPGGPPNKGSLQDALTAMGYKDGPDRIVRETTPAVPQPVPAQQQAPASTVPPASAAPQPAPVVPQAPEAPQAPGLPEVLAKLANVLDRQTAQPSAPPVVQLPPQPELPPLPDTPEWAKSDEAWEIYYQQDAAKATRDLMDFRDKLREANLKRTEIQARYESEKETALKKQALAQGFYAQRISRGEGFAALEPVAIQILLKDQPELLQTMPPETAIKVAFDMAARFAAAPAPSPQPPASPPATGAAIQGQVVAGQLPPLTAQQLAQIKAQGVSEYLATLAGQAGRTPPVPPVGSSVVPPAQPITGARDATRALRASLGAGGAPR